MAADTNGRTVLITGATGKQGGAVARQLVGKGFHLRGLTRKPTGDAARALSALGVEIAAGDYDDAASIKAALKGAWGVFSVQAPADGGVKAEEAHGKELAELAKAADVQHFVYASVASANRETGIPHFESKARIEETVRKSGFPSYTIIRPTAFMENLLAPFALQGDKLNFGVKPTTVVQMVCVDDIGRFAALSFTKPTERNKAEVDLAGDAITLPEAASILSASLRRNISFSQTPIEQVRKHSEDMALMLEWLDRVGYNADIFGLDRKYGFRPLTLAAWSRKQVRT